MDHSAFEKIGEGAVPLDPAGNTLIDLYVYLPASDKYVRFVKVGTPATPDRLALLENHVVRDLFVISDHLLDARRQEFELRKRHHQEENAVDTLEKLNQSEDSTTTDQPKAVFSGQQTDEPSTVVKPDAAEPDEIPEVLGPQTQKELHELFLKFIDLNESNPDSTLKRFDQLADQILDTIVPEIKDLKGHLIKNLRSLMLMNDVSAITSLAVLIALAQGYDSKKSFRDLSYACLIMDTAMAEFTEDQIKLFYKDPQQLPADIYSRMRRHPAKSYEIAETKIKSISDVSMQLILNHHELFNGKGYPRGIRSESLFPMVKVLSFAVDIFETMRRDQLKGMPRPFNHVIVSFLESKIEPHLRRHNRKLVDLLIKYLDINPNLEKLRMRPEDSGDGL